MERRRGWKKLLAWLLTVVMVFDLGIPAYGYAGNKSGLLTVEGNDRQGITEEKSWEETFPNGTFAFKHSYQYLYEGKDREEKITVYRLGGTAGSAVANIAVTPAVTEMEDGEANTAYAASLNDFTIRVENPLYGEEEDEGETASGSNATPSDSSTAKKKSRNHPGYTLLDTSKEEEYNTVFFDLEFADGEYVKEIIVKANDDDEAETMEFALFTIYDAVGAEFTETANCLTLGIYDDEVQVESRLGFAVKEVRADKSAGRVTLTVERTEGIQYVAECSFRTAGGTAEAGTDYQKTDGTVAFAGGEKEKEITIELVDDGVITGEDDEEPYFDVQLYNPKAAYINEGADTVRVSLYNSGTGDGNNLATLLYTPDAVDLSGEITAGDALIETEKAPEIETATPDTKYAAAEYTPAVGNFNPYLRTTVTQDLKLDSNLGWNGFYDLAGPDKAIEAGAWKTKFPLGKDNYYGYEDGGVWDITTNNLAQTYVTIDRLYELYSRLGYYTILETDKGGGVNAKYRNSISVYVGRVKEPTSDMAYEDGSAAAKKYLNENVWGRAFYKPDNPNENRTITSDKNDGNHYAAVLSTQSGEKNKYNYQGDVSLEAIRDKADKKNLYPVLSENYNNICGLVESQANRSIHGRISFMYLGLERQSFVKNPVVVIHTADDYWDNRFSPEITLNTGSGGTTSEGKLYVGSTLRIDDAKNSGSFKIAEPPLLKYGDTTVNKAGGQSGNYSLTLVYGDKNKGYVSGDKQYTIDVTMDRVQNVMLDYNAVETAVIPGETGEEREARIKKVTDQMAEKLKNASYTYRTVDLSSTGGYKTVHVSNSSFEGPRLMNGVNKFSLSGVKNLQSINFNMDADDIIIYNQKFYRGNETITILQDDYKNPDLNFGFADSSVLDKELVMTITGINSMEVYIDVNHNGIIDGEDVQDGVLAENGEYMIADLEPVFVGNNYRQRLLRLSYSMTPKYLKAVPPGGSETDTCEVVPNLVTAITNPQVRERLSSQMKEYRPLKTTDGDQLMYGEPAAGGSVTIPLGGDLNPPEFTNGAYSWNPEWKGNLSDSYQLGVPEDIILNGTVKGDDFLAASQDDPDALKGYLGSIHGDDTISMTIQYQKDGDTVIDSTRSLGFTTIPAKTPAPMDLSSPGAAAADTEGRSSDIPNLTNTEPEMQLPDMKLPIGPLNFVSSKGMLGLTIGTDIFEAGSNKKSQSGGQGQQAQTRDTYTQSDRVINELQSVQNQASEQQKTILQVLRERRNGQGQGAGDSPISGGGMAPTTKSNRNTDLSLAVSISFLWKYSPISNNYEFYSAGFFMSMGASQRVTVRLDVCPIFYAYVTLGAELGMGTGLTVEESVNAQGARSTRVKWDGATIDAEMFIEVGAGVGIELVSAEIFVKGTVAVQFAITAEPSFKVNKFITRAAIGYRIVLLFITYELEALSIEAGYDVTPDPPLGWYWKWYALGKEQGGGQTGRNARMLDSAEFDSPGLKIRLPDNTYYEENVYTPEDNLPNRVQTRAFDVEDAPFQVSGYGSSVTGAKLADGMNLGSSYKMVTWEKDDGTIENYVLYLGSRKPSSQSGTMEGLNASALMLSKLDMVTKGGGEDQGDLGQSAIGLAYPIEGGTAGEPYLMVDEDEYGDLDFSAEIYDGKMVITWTSYTEAMKSAVDQYEADQDYMAFMNGLSSATTVKTRVLDLAGTSGAGGQGSGFGNTVTMATPSSASAPGEYKYLPQPAGEKTTIFAKSTKYTAEELEELSKEYESYYQEEEVRTNNYPYVQSEYQYKVSMAASYGKRTDIGIGIADDSGKVREYTLPVAGSGVKASASNALRVGQLASYTEETADGAEIWLAYTTEEEIFSDQNDLLTVKKLYLQQITVIGNEIKDEDVGSPILIENQVESARDETVSGEYGRDGGQTESRDGVYFANLKFLNGKIESSTPETFFLYNKNGETYYYSEASIRGLLGGSAGSAEKRPIFGKDDANAATRGDVTIGADPAGNLTAVYTNTVENTANNALCMSKYDPDTGWGDGVMLAMNRMQVYEDANKNGWDQETTVKAYYLPEKGRQPDKFVFSAPQIASGLGDELVILAGGVKTPLSVFYYGLNEDGSIRVKEDGSLDASTTEDEEHPYMQAVQDSGERSVSGVYALAYGTGHPEIGDGRISFAGNTFIPGERLLPAVTFKNTGDTAIRGSDANPVMVRLMMTGQKSGAADTELASWKIKGNIPAGRRVTTADASGDNYLTEPLPENLSGRTIYFTVEEDSTYITEGAAFSYSSLPEEGKKKDETAIVIDDKPELVLSDVRVGAEGHSNVPLTRSGEKTIDVEMGMTVENAGTSDASEVTVAIEYSNSSENGSPVYEAVAQSFKNSGAGGYTLEQTGQPGVFTVMKGQKAAVLQPGEKASIAGTISMPVSCYDTSGAYRAMKLRITTETAAEEYDTSNNESYQILQAFSTFDAPVQITLIEKTPVQLAIPVETADGEQPEIMVTELAADGKTKLLQSISYNPVSQILSIVPKESSGSGIVRIADMATSSYKDMAFTITGQGVNINQENPLLTFEGSGWQDLTYPDANPRPYMGDLANASRGNTVSFETYAAAINLYFEGEVKVSSSLAGHVPESYTGDGYDSAVKIDFGNRQFKKHTVTLEILSDKGKLDRYTEDYMGQNPWEEDRTKPVILAGKTPDPKPGSLKPGEVFNLPFYVADDMNLSGVYIGGSPVTYESGEFAWGTLKISQNGEYLVYAYDGNGNKTEMKLEVDWFSDLGTERADQWPDITDAYLADEAGDRLTGEPVMPRLKAEFQNGDGSKSSIKKDWSMDPSATPVPLETEYEGGSITTKEALEAAGYYLVEVSNGQTGENEKKTRRLVQVEEVISKGPEVVLMEASNDKGKIYYSAGSENGGVPIQSVAVYAGANSSGTVLVKKTFGSSSKTRYISGSFDKRNSGAYYIVAEDIRGQKTEYLYSVYAVLSSLTLSEHGELLEFKDYVTEYDITLPYKTATVPTVEAKAAGGSQLQVKQAESLEAGKNQAVVIVSQTVNEQTISRTYTITFTVEKCLCNITELKLDGGNLVIGHDSDSASAELHAVGFAQECPVEGHHADPISYHYELVGDSGAFELEGNKLTAKDSGTVTVKVRAEKNDGITKEAEAEFTAVKKVRITTAVRELDQKREAGRAYIENNDYLGELIVDKGTEVTVNTCQVFDELADDYDPDAPKTAASKGYAFARWEGGAATTVTPNRYSFIANENVDLTAVFTDTTAPEGEITVADSSWKEFLNTITFGLFFKETQKAVITATDNDKTKEPEIGYCVSDHDMTEEEVKALGEERWQAYTKEISLNPDQKAVVYARLRDQDGNTTYLRSDGLVIDGTGPVLVLPDDMTEFTSKDVEILVQVSDELAGVEQVSYRTDEAENGQSGILDLTAGHGTFTLKNNGVYTVTVTAKDRSGNEVSDTVKVMIDKTVPSVRAKDTSDEWVNHPVELSVVTGTAGVSKPTLTVSRDGGAEEVIPDNGTYTAKDNGTYRFTVTTGAGVSASHTVTVSRIDYEKPALTVTALSESSYVPYVIDIAFADGDSGMDRVWYTTGVGTQEHEVETKDGTGRIVIYKKAKDTVKIYARDTAGNVAAIAQEVDLSFSQGGSGGSGSSGGSGGRIVNPGGKKPLLKKLYHENGQPAYETWVWENGNWYYAGADGMAVTGWFKDPLDGYWYYLKEDGTMAVGWIFAGGGWYCLNPVSADESGWKYNALTGKMEYHDGSNVMPLGAMYFNTTTPDGYPVDATGKWIQ